jgi:hypothetical protein
MGLPDPSGEIPASAPAGPLDRPGRKRPRSVLSAASALAEENLLPKALKHEQEKYKSAGD